MSKIICKYCNDCKQIGRMRDQGMHIGRKTYYCEHPATRQIKNKHGLPQSSFIGYGEPTMESPLAKKTSPRWCPRKKGEVNNINE